MVKKLLVSTLILGGVVLAPITASAWEAGETDPNEAGGQRSRFWKCSC